MERKRKDLSENPSTEYPQEIFFVCVVCLGPNIYSVQLPEHNFEATKTVKNELPDLEWCVSVEEGLEA